VKLLFQWARQMSKLSGVRNVPVDLQDQVDNWVIKLATLLARRYPQAHNLSRGRERGGNPIAGR
jgi:hypothetical protein